MIRGLICRWLGCAIPRLPRIGAAKGYTMHRWVLLDGRTFAYFRHGLRLDFAVPVVHGMGMMLPWSGDKNPLDGPPVAVLTFPVIMSLVNTRHQSQRYPVDHIGIQLSV